jgi:hypothetical protein
MMSGGTTATPARTVQLETEFKCAATPAMDTVDTQSMAMRALIESSCMFSV